MDPIESEENIHSTISYDKFVNLDDDEKSLVIQEVVGNMDDGTFAQYVNELSYGAMYYFTRAELVSEKLDDISPAKEDYWVYMTANAMYEDIGKKILISNYYKVALNRILMSTEGVTEIILPVWVTLRDAEIERLRLGVVHTHTYLISGLGTLHSDSDSYPPESLIERMSDTHEKARNELGITGIFTGILDLDYGFYKNWMEWNLGINEFSKI